MATPHARQQKTQKPVNQAINNGKKEEVLKEEHRLIQGVFFERMKAYRDWEKLEELYPGQKGIFEFMLNEQDSILKNINPKDVNSFDEENFRQLLLSTFKKIRKQHLANYEINQILAKKGNSIGDEINQILVKKGSVTGDEVSQILAKEGNVTGNKIKKILTKKGNLIGVEIQQILAKKGNVTGDEVSQIVAKKENLTGDEISQIVAKRVVDAQWTETKDKIIKFAGGLFGMDVDPKDISGSIKRGLLEKIPFVGDGKEKENNEPSLRGTQVVTKFLRQSLLPIVLFAFSLLISSLIFGISSITLTIAVIVLLVTEVKAVKSLFSNDNSTHKKDENIPFFSSHYTNIWEKTIENAAKLKQDAESQKEGEWSNKFNDDIVKILQKQQKNQTTQVTDPQAAQAGADQEENMSQTKWTERAKNKVDNGHELS